MWNRKSGPPTKHVGKTRGRHGRPSASGPSVTSFHFHPFLVSETPSCAFLGGWTRYREVQGDITPEIEVFHMLFERCHYKYRKRSIKLPIKYVSFRSKIQLDLPVDTNVSLSVSPLMSSGRTISSWMQLWNVMFAHLFSWSTLYFRVFVSPLHPSLDRFKWRVSKITGPGRARGGLRRCRCRVAQSCVKHSCQVSRITLKMFRCPPQKCTIEQYFSQPFPKPDGIFLHYSVFGEKMPPRWLSRDGVSRKSHIHSLLVFCYSSSSICC